LSFVDSTNTVTTDKNINIVTHHKSNIMTLSYVFKRSSATGTAYTTQILSTSVAKNDLITNLVFHGWYLNGYLYSQNATINLPLIKTVGNPAEPEPEGYVIIFNKTTKVIDALIPLMYNGTHYSFTYGELREISVPEVSELNNFSGSLNADLGYEYMSSDNIKLTASYGTFTKVTYETKPEGSEEKHLVSSAISSNLLGITTNNASVTKKPGTYYTINDETIFNTLYDSKSYLQNEKATVDLGTYRLTSAIATHTIDRDCVYVQSGSNALITAGHTLGYRITGYTYSGKYVKITGTPELGYTYELVEFSDNDPNHPVSIISSEGSMGYVAIGNDEILTEITIKPIYEKVFQISTFLSTLGEYDDETSDDTTASTGGSIKLYSFERDNKVNVSDGVFYSNTYPMISITCTPNAGYTFVGLYINGLYMSESYVLAADGSYVESYNNTNELIIDTRRLGYTVTEENGDVRKDLVIEARFAKNIRFSVRLAMQTTDRSKLALYGINSSIKEKFDVNIRLSSIYNTINYGAAGNFKTTELLEKSIWSIYEKLPVGSIYDENISYSTSEYENVPYTSHPSTSPQYWDEKTDSNGDKYYVSTRNNQLYIVDDDDDNKILKLEYEVAYGTYIDLSVMENIFTVGTQAYKFDGWYLYRGNQASTSISAINYSTGMGFYATHDYYSASIDIIAKYSPTNNANNFAGSNTVTTNKKVELIDETSNYNVISEIDINKITVSKDGVIGNLENNILTYSGNRYLFTGWWEPIADSVRPTTYILVASNYDDKLPESYVDNLVARFVRVLPVEIVMPKPESGYVQGRLNYRYFYTQGSVIDNRLGAFVTNGTNEIITLELPVDTYFNGTTINAYQGHYFNIRVNGGTSSKYDEFIITNPDNRVNNTTGTRYELNKVSYVMRDGVVYYINGTTLYKKIEVNEHDNKINFTEELTGIVYSVKKEDGVVIFSIGSGTYYDTITDVNYVVYNDVIYYVRGSNLFDKIDSLQRLETVGSGVHYLVSNSVVIFEKPNNELIGTSNPIVISSVAKVGYKYAIESDYDLLTIVNGGHTISYVVTTIDENQNYGTIADKNVGGTLTASVKTVGGTASENNKVFSSTYSMLYLKATPKDKNYRLIGIYINGKYVDNTYNKENITINLESYSEDIVIEAKFAILVQATYRLVVDTTDSTSLIKDYYGITDLSMSGNLTNIYNSVSASYQFGDNKITSASVIINDMDLYLDSTAMYFTVTV
ncbi:MAG: hypothetical protein IJA23_00675, partial [Clostridia bacterium]|nr:hypothetical protein [Clostridia bacterium]